MRDAERLGVQRHLPEYQYGTRSILRNSTRPYLVLQKRTISAFIQPSVSACDAAQTDLKGERSEEMSQPA
jgi:hypothetical protein